jgi:hypothetical protein
VPFATTEQRRFCGRPSPSDVVVEAVALLPDHEAGLDDGLQRLDFVRSTMAGTGTVSGHWKP